MSNLTDAPASLVYLIIGAVIFLIVVLASGVAPLEGLDEGVDRRKQPIAYWAFVLLLLACIGGGVFLIFG